MPIPKPNPDEKQSAYISRCIRFVIDEGTAPNTPEGRKQAAAICYNTWRRSKKSEDEPVIKTGLKDTNGYFCRLENSTKRHYYDIVSIESKESAIKNAQDEWFNTQIEELAKSFESEERAFKSRWNSNIENEQAIIKEIKKSKDELKSGDEIIYKGKKGKILKILEK